MTRGGVRRVPGPWTPPEETGPTRTLLTRRKSPYPYRTLGRDVVCAYLRTMYNPTPLGPLVPPGPGVDEGPRDLWWETRPKHAVPIPATIR